MILDSLHVILMALRYGNDDAALVAFGRRPPPSSQRCGHGVRPARSDRRGFAASFPPPAGQREGCFGTASSTTSTRGRGTDGGKKTTRATAGNALPRLVGGGVESAPTPEAAEYPGGSTSVARWNWRIVSTGHLNAGCLLHPLRLRRRRRRDGVIVVISSARSVLLASMPSYSPTSPRRGTTSCSRPVLSSRIDVVLRRDARFALQGWIRRRVGDGRRMDTQERRRQLTQFIQRRNSREDRIPPPADDDDDDGRTPGPYTASPMTSTSRAARLVRWMWLSSGVGAVIAVALVGYGIWNVE